MNPRRTSIKNYIYISESKISYLLPQAQPNKNWLKRLKFGLSVNVSGLKSEISTNSIEPETTVDKLNQLVSYIQKHELGKGNWEQLTMSVSHVHLFDPKNEFFLVGRIGPKTRTLYERYTTGVFILLCGNARHLIGNMSTSTENPKSYSYYPYVAQNLLKWSDSEKLLIQDEMPKVVDREIESDFSDAQPFIIGVKNSEVASVIKEMQINAAGPTFDVEFLALKLFEYHNKDGTKCFIYSPLYVAQVLERGL